MGLYQYSHIAESQPHPLYAVTPCATASKSLAGNVSGNAMLRHASCYQILVLVYIRITLRRCILLSLEALFLLCWSALSCRTKTHEPSKRDGIHKLVAETVLVSLQSYEKFTSFVHSISCQRPRMPFRPSCLRLWPGSFNLRGTHCSYFEGTAPRNS